MPTWSPRLFLACLLCAPACGDPAPQPSTDESSTGSDPTSTTNPTTSTSTTTMGTTPMPTTGPDTGDTTTGPNDTTSSGSTSDASTSSGSTSDASTGSTGSTSDASTGSTGSTSGGSTGGTTSGTTGVDPCAAGDGPDFIVTNNGFNDYVVDGVNDPTLTLVRGCSYTFDVTAVGHPFWIKTAAVTGVVNAYNDGVTNNGTASGLITWDVSLAAPNTLFYICQFHPSMTGTINIIDP